ncbi:Uncharacterised protein [Raoultella terrigena]|uniref:Uncharacterized protein n=1 Tax=Raoultella terrigena TaxID=577 RepID=A0A3P8KLD0_RAOTE|nr:Uncharacterised protein [Raoultella terrigena]
MATLTSATPQAIHRVPPSIAGSCGSANSVATPLNAPASEPALKWGNIACKTIKNSGSATSTSSAARVAPEMSF